MKTSRKVERGVSRGKICVVPRSVLGKQAVLRTKVPAASIGSGQAKAIVRAGPAAVAGLGADSAEAVWMVPSVAGADDDIGEITTKSEDGTPGTGDKRLVVSWSIAGKEGVEVSVTVLSETAVLKPVNKTVRKSAEVGTEGEAERRCVFVFSGLAGAGAGADPNARLLLPAGTALVCWCVVTAVSGGGGGARGFVVKMTRLDVRVP